MRLMMITQDFPPTTGGIQTYCRAYADQFTREFDWFGVLCPAADESRDLDRRLPYPVDRVPTRPSWFPRAIRRSLYDRLENHRVDATFHAQWQTVPAALYARANGWTGRIFVAAHGRELYFNPWYRIPWMNRRFSSFRRRVLRETDHLFPVSEFTSHRLGELGVEPTRRTVIPNGTDPDRFCPDPDDNLRYRWGLEGKRVLLTVSRLVNRKRVDQVLQAFVRLQSEHEDLHYLVVGDGPEKNRLMRMTRRLGLTGSVTFAGPVPHQELNGVYNSADLFVLPVRSTPPDVEGFGLVYLEANAAGLPVIGSRSGGVPSAVSDGETGYLVGESDLEGLIERIDSLVRDPERALELGRAGRERVIRRFEWEMTGRRLCREIRVRSGF